MQNAHLEQMIADSIRRVNLIRRGKRLAFWWGFFFGTLTTALVASVLFILERR